MDDDALNAFGRALRAATTPEQTFAALEDLARATVSVRLFTVMTVDREAMLARRAYSSHALEYPVSGAKPIGRDDWFAQVIDEGRVFSANRLSDIAKVFPDHALIGALGCGAVMNLPVVANGKVVATINLLDAEGAYPPETVARGAERLRAPAEAAVHHAL
jgi:hypothetical protein